MIGKIIGNYEITSELAQGGMGAVYLGKHLNLPREVVIKSILLAGYSQGTHELLKARFLREAFIQSQLDHPNVVRVYEFFVADENYYLIMEYVAGMSLADLLKNQGKIPAPLAIQLFKQALAGMEYAHNFSFVDETTVSHTGIVHRDIKPGNMLLDGQGRLKITDFGIVKVVGEAALTQSGFNPGTVAYMSPEQLCGLELDVRSDLYSLGVTFYEMLAGRLPFLTSNPNSDYEIRKGHIEMEPPALTKLCPEIPAQLNDIVMRSLRKNPADRYQSATEFLGALTFYEGKADTDLTGARMPVTPVMRQTAIMPTGGSKAAASGTEATQPRSVRASAAVPGSPVRVNVPLEPTSFRKEDTPVESGRGKLIAGAALLLILTGVAVPFLRSDPQSQPATASAENNSPVETAQPTAQVTPYVVVVQQPNAAPVTPVEAPAPVSNAALDEATAGDEELKQARNLETQERYREAMVLYENYLSNHPNAPQIGVITEHLKQLKQFQGLLSMADQELQKQDYEGAERDYKQAVMLKPESKLAKAGFEEARAQIARRIAARNAQEQSQSAASTQQPDPSLQQPQQPSQPQPMPQSQMPPPMQQPMRQPPPMMPPPMRQPPPGPPRRP